LQARARETETAQIAGANGVEHRPLVMPEVPRFQERVFKSERFGRLTIAEKEILQEATGRTLTVQAREDIRAAGDPTPECYLILDGFACEYMILPQGRRQIISFRIPGDFCDLETLLVHSLKHSVAALRPTTVAVIERQALFRLAKKNPRILVILWQDTLLDMAIQRQWIANVGQRNAYARIAHLICELCLRLQAVGLAHDGVFELPITQTDLADAVGLSLVQVNRTLRRIRADDLISWRGSTLIVHDQSALEAAAGFNAGYLKVHSLPPWGFDGLTLQSASPRSIRLRSSRSHRSIAQQEPGAAQCPE
jgi:CRP-like cAMP-binding protein